MNSNIKIEFRKTAKTEIIVFFLIFSILIIFITFAVIPLFFGTFGSHSGSKNKANAVNLKTAIIAYDTDYGNLPIPNGITGHTLASDLILGSAPGTDPSLLPLPGTANLFQGLCGNMNAYSGTATASAVTGINSRNISYLALSKSQVDKDGILVQSFLSSKGMPTYFGIMLDANYDNTLTGLPDPSMGTFTLSINDTTAVWGNNGQSYTTPNIRWVTTY